MDISNRDRNNDKSLKNLFNKILKISIDHNKFDNALFLFENQKYSELHTNYTNLLALKMYHNLDNNHKQQIVHEKLKSCDDLIIKTQSIEFYANTSNTKSAEDIFKSIPPNLMDSKSAADDEVLN